MDIFFQRLGVVQVLLVGFQDSGAMHHGVQWGPFLKENIDELIRHETRRRLQCLVR